MEKYNVEGIPEEIPELTAEDIALLKETLDTFVETLGEALETLADSICMAIETLYQIPHKSRGFPASYEGNIADEIIEENGERLIVKILGRMLDEIPEENQLTQKRRQISCLIC